MKTIVVFAIIMAIMGVISSTDRNQIIKKILENFTEGSPKELFKVWHHVYERSYALDTQEAKNRFAIFKANLKEIREHNAKNLPYKLGINQFSDMSKAEFRAKMLTKKVIKGEELDRILKELQMTPAFLEDDDDDLTKRNLARNPIDYTNFFPAARDQGNCGSCWTFSTSGAVEGNFGKKAGKPINYLSTQQLVDCDKSNNGCEGGMFPGAFAYVKKNGVEFDKDYPYKAAVGKCKYNAKLATNKVTGFQFCSNYSNGKNCSVDKVYGLLAQGPLSVGIDGTEIQSYTSGLFTASCSEDNHAVILVGFGVDQKSNSEYWLVRNSWGTGWGEAGYIKIAINDNNNFSCYVNNEAFLPVV
jgi:C1A family cysteine protease